MSLYETDFCAWAEAQAALLKAGRFDELDVPNLVEEVEDLAGRHRDALTSRLEQLFLHLLKWRYQPERRQAGHSWEHSIGNQRDRIGDLLEDYPSLRTYLPEAATKAYPRARRRAGRQTRLSFDTFPPVCPWTLEQVLGDNFWPEEPA